MTKKKTTEIENPSIEFNDGPEPEPQEEPVIPSGFDYEVAAVRGDKTTFQTFGPFESIEEAHAKLVEVRDGKGHSHHLRTEFRNNGVARLQIVNKDSNHVYYSEILNHIDGV